ncbi:hypothetical protein ACSDQ9_07625 [Aestuariimicrobium soli]|uniref:hypothetical protein n=1 Tax=Aestuariimicrobium soli TaxID=2035834 RepID=UPI003EB8542F
MTPSPLGIARQTKHRLAERLRHARLARTRARLRAHSLAHEPAWDPTLSPHHFVNRDPQVAPESWLGVEVPRRIFVCWTGDNPLTPNRERALASLRAVAEVPVEVVSPATLDAWIVPGAPVHEAYEHLSLVHRSDYLRAYLMHHHGGGYSDLKPARHSWLPAFDAMDETPDAMMLGYPEVDGLAVAASPEPLGRELRQHHTHLPGMCAFIARPGTPLSTMWWDEVTRTLDHHLPELRAHPGGVWGDDPLYPLEWFGILGTIVQPLAFRFHDHVLLRDGLTPQLTDYR